MSKIESDKYPKTLSQPLVNSMKPYDTVVIGAGPSGASCAYWLASLGFRVALVEKKNFPRDKTCGDGLTPRAVFQLENMGLKEELTQFHRYDGLRSIAFGRTLELPWPEHEDFPNYGYVAKRSEIQLRLCI